MVDVTEEVKTEEGSPSPEVENENLTKFKEQWKRHEGFRATPYKDTKGVVTVGYGHNLNIWPLPSNLYPLSEEAASAIFEEDRKLTEVFIDGVVPGLLDIKVAEPVRYFALMNVGMNIGANKLAKFHKMLDAVAVKDWETAAKELLDSKYARDVGDYAPGSIKAKRWGRVGRAWELAEQLRTGEWIVAGA